MHIIFHSDARHPDHFAVALTAVSKDCIMIDYGTDGPSGKLYISCLFNGIFSHLEIAVVFHITNLISIW